MKQRTKRLIEFDLANTEAFEGMVLSDNFPRLAEYISVLPEGLESHPECRSKGSLIRGALSGHEFGDLLLCLPKELAEHVRYPPPSTAWVSAVHNTALFYAVCDLYYPTEAAMEEWVQRRTTAMATGIYRGLLRVSGPGLFFRMQERTYGLLQKGSSMVTDKVEDNRITGRLLFPPHLFTHFMLLSNLPVYEVLTGLASGQSATSKLVRYDETSATYETTW